MTLLGLGRASKLPLLSLCVMFGILAISLSCRSPLRLNFVDVAMARHSKRVFSALALRNVNYVDIAMARHSKRAFSALALRNVNYVDIAMARHSKRAFSALALRNVNYVDVAMAWESNRAFSTLALRNGRQRYGQSARNKC